MPSVLILGAGPGGLAAAYTLLQAGMSVTILERDSVPGGLMRAVRHGDFMVDLGYKHLYDRIPEVHAFWQALLGTDFQPYEPRTGILYEGHLLERDRAWRGLRRGLPLGLLLRGLLSLLRANLKRSRRSDLSLEAYTHRRRGALLARIFSQEFDERFKGRAWSQLPAPAKTERKGLWARFMSDATKSLQTQEKWFHPACGTGQIVEMLEREILRLGGKICYETTVTGIRAATEGGFEVTALQGGADISHRPQVLISSLPLPRLARLLGIDHVPQKSEMSFRRGVVMVYLFLRVPVAWPHTSIHVSCLRLKMARVTNYGALGGRMVPAGRGCICVEYFTGHADALMHQTDSEIYDFALGECVRGNLLRADDCSDFFVLRSPDGDPATSWEDFHTDPSRRALLERIAQLPKLFQINRTGADKSTYAGIMAAQAILADDRARFETMTRADVNRPWEGVLLDKA